VKKFFVTRGVSTLVDEKLIRKSVYTDSLLPEEKAIQTMIDITLAEPDNPFPAAPEDGSRDDGYIRGRKTGQWWCRCKPAGSSVRPYTLGDSTASKGQKECWTHDCRLEGPWS
jgi:hypothetical protein